MPVLTESEIEAQCRRLAVKYGCKFLKLFNLPGYPDRLVLLPNGRHFLMECKREGGSLSPLQKQIHAELKAMNQAVFEVDNKHLFVRLLNERLSLPPP